MLDVDAINSKLDLLYPASAFVGYAILLQPNSNLQSGVSVTLDNSTNIFSSSATIRMITGSRIRLAGTFPSVASGDAINATTDYFVIRLSSTTFRLARTLVQAIASTAIDFTSDGSSLTYTEQQLNVNDPLNVLINKEVNSSNYNRRQIDNLPLASGGSKILVWSLATGSTSLSYRHRLIILGGTSTIGDTTGTKDHLITESSDIIIPSNNSAAFGVTLNLTSSL